MEKEAPRIRPTRLLVVLGLVVGAYYTGSARCSTSPSARQPVELAAAAAASQSSDITDLYLNFVGKAVVGAVFDASLGTDVNPEAREYNVHWRPHALSMIGKKSLDNVRALLEAVLENGVPGDFVECGVWRGGASIYARAIIRAYGDAERTVHVLDSFQGLPKNTTSRDGPHWSQMSFLSIPLETVRNSFQRHGLLDDQVQFHKGFFRYSIPTWRSTDQRPIAVLRMDGDMYESTMDILYNLYNAVSPGGYIIIDDYKIPECKDAVHEFMDRHSIEVVITNIDGNYAGAWFQKPAGPPVDISWYKTFNRTRTTDDING